MFPGKLPSRRVLVGGSILLLFIGVGLTFSWPRSTSARGAEIPFSELLTHVASGAVATVSVTGDLIDATLQDGRRLRTVVPPGYVAINPQFIPDLMSRGVRIDVRRVSRPGVTEAGPIVFTIGFLVLAAVALYWATAGRVPSLEGRSQVAEKTAALVTFADVAGIDEAKDEVREIVDFLREPGRFAAIGGRIPKGVLLVGPPGTGKTLLARSIAGEAGVPFLHASGADFVEMYAGVGAARVRRLFRDARRHAACIIFIDELDAVGRKRGSQSLSHEEREQTLNQLLVEMDGFEARQGIVVVAATNRQDILDPALLRAGRFDRQVTVGCPDVRGREQILRVHVRKVALAPGADVRAIARGTPGFSGADLANLVNEGALLAARAGRATVTEADLHAARDKVMMGVERRSLAMTERERVACAYHEAGHAVVAALLPDADPLHKVTIVPRGRALGLTMQLPESDRFTLSQAYLEAQLAILMGGRAAEGLFLSQTTSGASNDIERATDLARRMVCEFGMSPLGPLAFRRGGDPWGGEAMASISEETARRVDEEIRAIVMRGCDTARLLVERHRTAVQALADQLLVAETVDAEGIGAILAAAERRDA